MEVDEKWKFELLILEWWDFFVLSNIGWEIVIWPHKDENTNISLIKLGKLSLNI